MKHIISFLVLFCMVTLSCELASVAAFYVTEGTLLSKESLANARREQQAPDEQTLTQQPRLTEDVIHPYIGYVYDPEIWSKKPSYEGLRVSEWGFIDDKSPIQRRSPDRVVVGIFGGSVAWWFSAQGNEALRTELAKIPAYKNKEIVFVRTALGGFKQPQQLMTLSYLYSLGAEFDLVINLDGYNEMVLPSWDNMRHGVYPFYPQGWYLRTVSVPNKERKRLLAKLSFMEERQVWWAALFDRSLVSLSYTANVLWHYYNRYLEQQQAALRFALGSMSNEEATKSYITTGPGYVPADDTQVRQDLVAMWKNSSIQMHQLASANGAKYIHVLQPNQYVADSKPHMSEGERARAIASNSPSEHNAAVGYPYLLRAGKSLSEDHDIDFLDMTMVYREVREPIYVDDCCHVNKKGNQILGREIGKRIRALY